MSLSLITVLLIRRAKSTKKKFQLEWTIEIVFSKLQLESNLYRMESVLKVVQAMQ